MMGGFYRTIPSLLVGRVPLRCPQARCHKERLLNCFCPKAPSGSSAGPCEPGGLLPLPWEGWQPGLGRHPSPPPQHPAGQPLRAGGPWSQSRHGPGLSVQTLPKTPFMPGRDKKKSNSIADRLCFGVRHQTSLNFHHPEEQFLKSYRAARTPFLTHFSLQAGPCLSTSVSVHCPLSLPPLRRRHSETQRASVAISLCWAPTWMGQSVTCIVSTEPVRSRTRQHRLVFLFSVEERIGSERLSLLFRSHSEDPNPSFWMFLKPQPLPSAGKRLRVDEDFSFPGSFLAQGYHLRSHQGSPTA